MSHIFNTGNQERSRIQQAGMKAMLLLISGLLLVSCSPEIETGPGEMRWDRETCARCLMSVGDRHYATQVRGGPEGKITQLYKFDDIGCALVWLDKQAWVKNPSTEIWVNDHLNGEWIDARMAWYVTGKRSPMGYGFSAQSEKSDDAMNFTQVAKAIFIKDTELTGHEHHSHGLPEMQQ